MGLLGRVKNELIEGQSVSFIVKGNTIEGKFIKTMQYNDDGYIYPLTKLLLEDDKGYGKMRTFSEITINN